MVKEKFVCLHKIPFKKYIFQATTKKLVSKHTHIFSLEVKMVEILMDLNWKWSSENIRPL